VWRAKATPKGPHTVASHSWSARMQEPKLFHSGGPSISRFHSAPSLLSTYGPSPTSGSANTKRSNDLAAEGSIPIAMLMFGTDYNHVPLKIIGEGSKTSRFLMRFRRKWFSHNTPFCHWRRIDILATSTKRPLISERLLYTRLQHPVIPSLLCSPWRHGHQRRRFLPS
jgi:hypothetical protein